MNKEKVPKKEKPKKKSFLKENWKPIILATIFVIAFTLIIVWSVLDSNRLQQFCESNGFEYGHTEDGGVIVCNEFSENFEITPHYYSKQAIG